MPAVLRKLRLPIFILFVGILFTLYLVWQIPNEVFFSGDAGVKALLTKQFSSGKYRFDLDLETEPWIQQLWKNGLYPFNPPFVYSRLDRYYIQYPIIFSFINAPFYSLSGFQGYYVVPLVSIWLVWCKFYSICQRIELEKGITSIALAILIFASPLTLYGAMFWEHSLAVLLAFWGLATILFPKFGQLNRREALLSGFLVGCSVWFRAELACLILIIISIIIYQVQVKAKKNVLAEKNIKYLIGSMIVMLGMFFAFNTIVYGHPFGLQYIQVVKYAFQDSINNNLQNISHSPSNIAFSSAIVPGKTKLILMSFLRLIVDLLITFPAVIFPICFIVYLRKTNRLWLDSKIKLIYLIVFLFIFAVSLVAPGVEGKRWGPRIILPVIPLISLLIAIELNAVRKVVRLSQYRIITLFITFLFVLGGGINTCIGTERLINNYRYRVSPALSFLQKAPDEVVAVSDQFVAQELMPGTLNQKNYFLTHKHEQFETLGKALVKKNLNQFLYVCMQWSRCYPVQERQEYAELSLNQSTAMKLSKIGEFGIYTIYQVTLNSSS